MESAGCFHFTAEDRASALDTCLARRSFISKQLDHGEETIFVRTGKATFGLRIWSK
jgi:hypothetical protein